jgi:hypothetical protein
METFEQAAARRARADRINAVRTDANGVSRATCGNCGCNIERLAEGEPWTHCGSDKPLCSIQGYWDQTPRYAVPRAVKGPLTPQQFRSERRGTIIVWVLIVGVIAGVLALFGAIANASSGRDGSGYYDDGCHSMYDMGCYSG